MVRRTHTGGGTRGRQHSQPASRRAPGRADEEVVAPALPAQHSTAEHASARRGACRRHTCGTRQQGGRSAVQVAVGRASSRRSDDASAWAALASSAPAETRACCTVPHRPRHRLLVHWWGHLPRQGADGVQGGWHGGNIRMSTRRGPRSGDGIGLQVHGTSISSAHLGSSARMRGLQQLLQGCNA